ncbi:MAG TPA: BrnT family toxin [Thermoanaerobaculia bacterium]|nr:BrnT family toxin [Thermoanaerobaculia bacterium]
MKVEWDEAKNLTNRRKHRISFEEAEKLFTSSSDYLEIFDEVHSEAEDRFIAIGPVTRGLILVVWTARDDDTLCIISARWANEREQALYHSYMDESL